LTFGTFLLLGAVVMSAWWGALLLAWRVAEGKPHDESSDTSR